MNRQGPPAAEQLLDIAAVARRLGVGERHVRRLVFERRIPYLKWGRLIRFDPKDLERWLDGQRQDVATIGVSRAGARRQSVPSQERRRGVD